MRPRSLNARSSDTEGAGLLIEIFFEDATARDETRVLEKVQGLLSSTELGRFYIRGVHAAPRASEVEGDALKRGEARLVEWTQDGTLVPVSLVESVWGIKRQSVDAARNRGELISIYTRGQHWYPAEALKLERADLARIVQALGERPPSSLVLFFLRRYPSLSGRTVAEAVAQGMLEDVLRVARASEEA